MKTACKLIILALTILALAASAYAESPSEQLQQMVEQLQKTPGDNALREKIIKYAVALKPAPALPDEAVRSTGRSMFIFKTAKNDADYLDAAREYENAVASAPWVASYYADLCTIYEKASKYTEAKRACDFALIGTTDSGQAVELKQRIAGFEIGIERSSPATQAKREREAVAKKSLSLVGNWKLFVNGMPQRAGGPGNLPGSTWSQDFHYRFEMKGDEILVYFVTDSDEEDKTWCRRAGGGWPCTGDEDVFAGLTVEGNVIRGKILLKGRKGDIFGTFSESDIKWEITWTDNNRSTDNQILRKQR